MFSTTTSEQLSITQRKKKHPYTWVAGYIGAVGLAAVILNGVGWFTLPMDVVGAGAWFTVITVMIIAPFTLIVMLCAWGVLALLRKTGLRAWPSFLQALLPSIFVLVVLAIVAVLLFAEYE